MGREEDSKISPPKENETPLHAGTHEAPNHILAFFIQALSLSLSPFSSFSIQINSRSSPPPSASRRQSQRPTILPPHQRRRNSCLLLSQEASTNNSVELMLASCKQTPICHRALNLLPNLISPLILTRKYSQESPLVH